MVCIQRVLKVSAFVAIVIAPIVLSADQKSKIHPDLQKAFETDGNVKKNIVLHFQGNPAQVLEKFNVMARTAEVDTGKLNEDRIAELQLLRDVSQAKVLDFMSGTSITDTSVQHNSCWITNQIFVKGANKDLVEKLESFTNVEEILEERVFHIPKPFDEGPIINKSRINTNGNASKINEIQWNIQKIRSMEALGTFKSQRAVTVGVIDTGIHQKHEAFSDNMVAEWKDAVNNRNQPYDDNGHGTHVAGTIAGQKGIGVMTRNVTFYCCKACSGDGACTQSSLSSCGQFMMQKNPMIVSNSWGGPGGEKWFDPIMSGWAAAGIISVFSAGNSGPGCNSVGSPADHLNAISVAATNIDDGLAEFSSRGPSETGLKCPSVSAPGKNINSAWMSSNSAYRTISGTSMAAPHVSGLFALLMSQRTMTAAQAKTAVLNSCVTSTLADPHQTCGGTKFQDLHNNMFGNGRIDCMNALKLANVMQEKINKKKLI